MQFLASFLYLAIPLGAVVFFAVSLWQFLSAKKQNRKQPDSISKARMKILKLRLIIACVIAGCLVAIVIGFMLLLLLAVAYM